ncbi:uncharacterized protein LOC123642188 [Lemur catta]|uniref:uncharacterized protein LOC123642188 n=1 Tax=Lemur catta TaxID=9447 RepID=UPI001E26DAB7|nr:uncharacterized protein LOC123642188 [Lemur catta]
MGAVAGGPTVAWQWQGLESSSCSPTPVGARPCSRGQCPRELLVSRHLGWPPKAWRSELGGSGQVRAVWPWAPLSRPWASADASPKSSCWIPPGPPGQVGDSLPPSDAHGVFLQKPRNFLASTFPAFASGPCVVRKLLFCCVAGRYGQIICISLFLPLAFKKLPQTSHGPRPPHAALGLAFWAVAFPSVLTAVPSVPGRTVDAGETGAQRRGHTREPVRIPRNCVWSLLLLPEAQAPSDVKLLPVVSIRSPFRGFLRCHRTDVPSPTLPALLSLESSWS